MSGVGALFFADWRSAVNDARRALRSPGRLMLWLLYAGGLALFFWSRVYGRGGGIAGARADLLRADYFMSALLVTLALALASGRGAVGIFRTRAEARFIIGSPLAAPTAIAYLQAREALSQAVRLLFSFIYFILVFGPRHVGPAVVVADVLLIVAMMAAAAAVVVPRRLLPAPAGIVCACVGAPLALLAAAPAIRDVLAQAAVPLPRALADRVLAALPPWHPGTVLLEPSLVWLGAVAAVVAVAIAVLAAAGRDAYPELYAMSVARIDRLERWRQRRARGVLGESPAPVRRRTLTAGTAPAGVLIFVWKSIVDFRRQVPLVYVGAGIVGCGLAGFAAARFVSTGEGALFSALIGVVINVLVLVGITATSALYNEIRRPLFWLAPAPLFERLCALALARIWRTIIMLEIVAAGYAFGGGGTPETLVVAAGLPALVALLAGVGFAVYAFYPSTADWRGPVAVLRLLVSIVLLAPVFVLYSVGAAFVTPLAALGAAALLALLEAGALLGIAAWRLDGHVDRLASG